MGQELYARSQDLSGKDFNAKMKCGVQLGLGYTEFRTGQLLKSTPPYSLDSHRTSDQ